MKHLSIVVFALALLSLPVVASADGTMNTHAGNWQIGVNAPVYGGSNAGALFFDNTASGSWSLGVNGPVQYFVMDNLSVGGVVGFGLQNTGGPSATTTTTFTIGPAATYYFWTQGQMATYVAAAVMYNTSSAANSVSNVGLQGAVGFNYFLTPSVAFGPVVSDTVLTTSPAGNFLSVGALFSLYL